jgi:hypothetical protein
MIRPEARSRFAVRQRVLCRWYGGFHALGTTAVHRLPPESLDGLHPRLYFAGGDANAVGRQRYCTLVQRNDRSELATKLASSTTTG